MCVVPAAKQSTEAFRNQGDSMDLPQRKSNRIKHYDYSQYGAYFVTLCTQDRAYLFQMEAAVEHGTCNPANSTPANSVIHKWIGETQKKFPGVSVDLYVIMPDHLHMLITLTLPDCLPDVMHFLKTMTTNEYIRAVKSGLAKPFSQKLWQRSYYDHVIRNQQDYHDIWDYIQNNPAKWMLRHENP